MNVNIDSLGLKSTYDFKQTHIGTSPERNDIHRKLRRIVAPVIRALECEGLINGFHHIIHQDIDLRLSSNRWQQNESRIKEILASHSIPTDLANWRMPEQHYGGPMGVLLCYNNLEYNSRLCLALVELMHETDDESTRQAQGRLCPRQWVHYLCNQFGYLNRAQIKFEFEDAFTWLHDFVCRNPQGTPFARNIISQLKRATTQFEGRL